MFDPEPRDCTMKFSVLPMLLLSTIAIFCGAARSEEMSWKNVIDRSMACDNPNGNEIRESHRIAAPEGKAFDKESVKVNEEAGTRSFTDAAGRSGCWADNLTWQNVDVQTKSGKTVSISVLKAFDVASHADCGSGEARTWSHMSKGEKIVTKCSASAKTFDLKDLQ
ncbi:hypothetical protein [Bradyrhizobium japonicum]|nr:hypothetical protein [Bradyrhizobium japonicum]